MAESNLDRARCPVCGERNDCGMESGAEHCWCYDAEIRPDAIERVPLEARGVVCLCQRCATRADDAPPTPG